MTDSEPAFTIGIEEEYHLVDPETRQLASDPPDSLFEECEERLGEQVAHEFMASQIEVGTSICKDLAEARQNLSWLRGSIAEVAHKHGLAPIASATHPFSQWEYQHHTDKERYNAIAQDLQGVSRRLLICGMHVHVGIEDDELRIDLMGQAKYFLPHLLALSTSSPFWRGSDSGLMSYRLAIFRELPRTGLPADFESHTEFQRHVQVLVDAGIIEDGTKIWWDIRPNARFPTIEMRICDVCPRMEDALAIAALYVCILRMLYRLKGKNQRWRQYKNMLIGENRWRAQRHGIDEGLVDYGLGKVVPMPDLIEELIELTAEDAEAHGCQAEIAHLRTMLREGTGAHRQRRRYEQAVDDGADHDEAMRSVVDLLIAETCDV